MSDMVSTTISEPLTSENSTVSKGVEETLPIEDVELIDGILAEHKPSANPVSRVLWVAWSPSRSFTSCHSFVFLRDAGRARHRGLVM